MARWLDEIPNTTITACGMWMEPGAQCATRLQEADEQPEGALQYHAWCSVHGLVPIFPQLPSVHRDGYDVIEIMRAPLGQEWGGVDVGFVDVQS